MPDIDGARKVSVNAKKDSETPTTLTLIVLREVINERSCDLCYGKEKHQILFSEHASFCLDVVGAEMIRIVN